jgi:hypothetical protein
MIVLNKRPIQDGRRAEVDSKACQIALLKLEREEFLALKKKLSLFT